MGTLIKLLIVLFVGATTYKLFKGIIICILWVATAVTQILIVVGFFLLVAYMASKGWITI